MESRWSDGQIELFHALGKICERVGQEGADELLREGPNGQELNALDGGAFLEELRELRERARSVDGLQKENLRLRAELDVALRDLDADSTKMTPKAVNRDDGDMSRSMGTQTKPNFPDEKDIDWNASHERLMQKHNMLIESYKELVFARNQLENKLRSSQRSNKGWVEYANGLEKRIGRLEKKLTSNGIPLKRRLEGDSAVNTTPSGPSSAGELVPLRPVDASLETLRRELPNLLHMSERISELTRNAAVGAPAPANISPYVPQHISTDQSELQHGNRESNDARLHLLNYASRLHLDSSASDGQVSRASPSQFTKAAAVLQHDPAHPASSEPHDSGTTEEDIHAGPDSFQRDQIDIPPPIIKAEPLSDTPIVISSRSVKKRKTCSGNGSTESASYTKVKVEIVTSSPIGLAGFQNLFPQESMDLDEIGEKMNTPKKRCRAMQDSRHGNDLTTYNKLPAALVQSVGVQRGGINAQPKRHPSALLPASPNKQILLRTSGKEREPKRRRLGERMRGAVILGEDGENDVTSKIGSETEIQSESPRKLSANTAELQRRLSGLLEEPSPEKEVLTPARPSAFSTATAQLRARATPTDRYERPTSSARRQVGAGATPNTVGISRDTPKTDHKPSTAKKRTAGTPKDIGAFDANGLDQDPLRTRSVRRLGLEHFKVNPNFNQGSDYAFSDVVRGREMRKCLPGCTKPECCGDKFRKFIEFSRAHEQPTLSQEEENERLLEDYLGDNRGRLRNMTQREKEGVLIQAKARELANKASKHRHAYERRRSPPGFWRSDFPSTQELLTDRQEAANRERELVQHRYEEAMRPGGRWLFRDE